MGTAISDFGVGGRGFQDVRGVLQGGGPSGVTVRIRYMVCDTIHRQDNRGISPSVGLLSDGQTTKEGHVQDLEVPPSG